MKLVCDKKEFELSERTHIMGIINCTPDSFYDGSRYETINDAVKIAESMAEAGADFLDIGGESSRPGSDPVSAQEELKRVVPVIEAIHNKVSLPISIDTYKAEVAHHALNAGAAMVNDISALTFDAQMAKTVAEHNVPVVLMHIKGKPKEMQKNPSYGHVVKEVSAYLQERIDFAQAEGIDRDKIILDPGIGFGKRLDDNYQLLHQLGDLTSLNCPVLIGLSRKSFLQRVLDLPASECLEGTVAMHSLAILKGAHILRVHDVKEAKRAALIVDYYLRHIEVASTQ